MHKTRAQRQAEAIARQSGWNEVPASKQLEILDSRLGVGAKKQRARLAKLLS